MWSSKFEVVMGECLTPDPPTTTPKLQLDFLDLENFLVNIWGGGGGGCLALMWSHEMCSSKFEVVVGGVWHQTPPPTTTPKLQQLFGLRKFYCQHLRWWWGVGVSVTYVIIWNLKTYISHPLKCRMCQNWLKWCSDTPPPPPPPKLQLDFLDLESSTWLFQPQTCFVTQI